ncbi:hypothetical protein AAVH_05350 [Aphelenchoides avenae]|nr:hypothetical protein AAVH_05350 [Aphelenchus avenae]
MVLLVFDVITNDITGTPVAVTAAIATIICAILSFIAARRLDKVAQVLLVIFAASSSVLCLVLFVEAAAFINSICRPSSTVQCLDKEGIVHITLLCLSLIQLVVSCAIVFVCFRSLRQAYVVDVERPFNALIAGDYKKLRVEPETLSIRSNKDRLQDLLKV